MPQPFWLREYRKKAALDDPVSQSGRGRHFQAVEFLHVARQAIELLDLRREHDLLDVGCANGLLDIVLSGCCRNVLAIEPVEEQVALARRNLAGCSNVRVETGHGAAVPAPDSTFDRILVSGVIQMAPPDEVRAIFRELRRVARPASARLALVSVPDVRTRDAFLGPYLEGVRAAAHLSEEQKAEIVARNLAGYWYDPGELLAWWRELGGGGEVHSLSTGDPDGDHRFHLTLVLGS
jgi:SAM-dependent methyltransferase